MKEKQKLQDIQFELIITIVNRGYCDFVVEAARNAGASGGTIVNGRGTGIHENDSILGVSIQPEKEMVLTLVKKEDKRKVMQAIVDGANLNREGKGISFSLPVEDVAGINHLLKADSQPSAPQETQEPSKDEQAPTKANKKQKSKKPTKIAKEDKSSKGK